MKRRVDRHGRWIEENPDEPEPEPQDENPRETPDPESLKPKTWMHAVLRRIEKSKSGFEPRPRVAHCVRCDSTIHEDGHLFLAQSYGRTVLAAPMWCPGPTGETCVSLSAQHYYRNLADLEKELKEIQNQNSPGYAKIEEKVNAIKRAQFDGKRGGIVVTRHEAGCLRTLMPHAYWAAEDEDWSTPPTIAALLRVIRKHETTPLWGDVAAEVRKAVEAPQLADEIPEPAVEQEELDYDDEAFAFGDELPF